MQHIWHVRRRCANGNGHNYHLQIHFRICTFPTCSYYWLGIQVSFPYVQTRKQEIGGNSVYRNVVGLCRRCMQKTKRLPSRLSGGIIRSLEMGNYLSRGGIGIFGVMAMAACAFLPATEKLSKQQCLSRKELQREPVIPLRIRTTYR